METNETLDPAVEKELASQLRILKNGVVEITPENEFVKMLRHSIATNTPLRVKCGIDPTGFDVHLGHLVPYRKMRQFQDLGHRGVVVIGDYTATIGDPSGRSDTRASLTAEQVRQNAETYMSQVYTVLHKDRTEICYQSEWFAEITLRDVMKWAGETTVSKLLSHDTFAKRLENAGTLFLHEMFYPVLQGIDSVYIKADVELGGTDQKFNVMMGRDYQRNRGMRPQVAMLLPLLMGTCGTQKMGKSLGNYIAINDLPFDKFGKVMSIPDRLMLDYYQFITDLSIDHVEQVRADLASGALHPNEAKKRLASEVVRFFHGAETSQQMREEFERVFAKGQIPDEVPEYQFTRDDLLVNILFDSQIVESKGEGRRLITQNAVSVVDGEKLSDANLKMTEAFAGKVLKIGKRKFLRLK